MGSGQSLVSRPDEDGDVAQLDRAATGTHLTLSEDGKAVTGAPGARTTREYRTLLGGAPLRPGTVWEVSVRVDAMSAWGFAFLLVEGRPGPRTDYDSPNVFAQRVGAPECCERGIWRGYAHRAVAAGDTLTWIVDGPAGELLYRVNGELVGVVFHDLSRSEKRPGFVVLPGTSIRLLAVRRADGGSSGARRAASFY